MVRNDRRDAWWATPKRCSDMGPSARVNTETTKIDALRIQRMGVPQRGQHPRKKLLQRPTSLEIARSIKEKVKRTISPATGRSENVRCAFQPMSCCESLGTFSFSRFISLS